jgi:energy-coupling factor transporter ATP-binding protein EcfA2
MMSMALSDDILDWSESQYAWQQDALRRIFQGGSLTTTDLNALYALANEDAVAPSAQPLTKNHIAAASVAGVVRLLAIKDLHGVNAFPAGRQIEFAPVGMTVIFGENGAGKSGYARVLKRACRARHSQRVRGNAFDTNAGSARAKALLRFELDGIPKQVAWVDDQPADEALSSVVVYDAACADDYIESEGEPTFKPFGLRALAELGKACKALEERVSAEVALCPTDKTPFEGLKGDTEVGRYIASLSRNSDLTVVRQLGALSDIEHLRLKELLKILSESDPEPRAKSLERLASRVTEIGNRFDRTEAYVAIPAVAKLRGFMENVEKTSADLNATKAMLAKKEHLPGTGGKNWTSLIGAAREFSIKDAYPGTTFPNIDSDARCVLCQGVLTDPCRANLLDYEAFASSTASLTAAAAIEILEVAKRKIESASVDVGIDDATRAELIEQGSDLVTRIEKWAETWETRRGAMVAAASANDFDALPEPPSDAATNTDIRRVAETLKTRATELRASGDPAIRAKLIKEHAELMARSALAPHVPAIEKYIGNATRLHELSKVRSRCTSLAVSRRMTELADKYLTDELLAGMKDELKAIGYSRLTKHKIPKRTAKGVTLCRVALDGASAPVEDILSEGEQRATAFSFFLAELRLNEKKSTLVFDDPVTSLDHRYRRKIADRLAKLACERQVIVFTHDAVFLTNLQRAAVKAACPIEARHIEWDTAPGLAMVGLGWDLMGASERIQGLRQMHAKLEKDWVEYPNEANKREMSHIYDQLRGTMERVIREHLLNDVMAPFSDEIKVEAFEAIIGMDTAQWESFVDVYDRACEAMRGHDTTGEAQVPMPTPDQLNSDIDVLQEVVASAKLRKRNASDKQTARGKNRRKGLESLGMPGKQIVP